MEYLFVFDEDNNGWWLQINTIDELVDYHDKTNTRTENAFELYIKNGHPSDILDKLDNSEQTNMLHDKNFKLLQYATMLAEKHGGSIIDGFRMARVKAVESQIETLRHYDTIYFNRAGGHTFGIQYKQFCRRKTLVFPDFKKSDIRVKKYKGGSHYYAYIDDMFVQNKDSIKWNTYDAAYAKALELITQ